MNNKAISHQVYGDNDNESDTETCDLRKSLEYAVLQIVLHEDARSGMRTTSGAIRALSELTWQYIHRAMIPDLNAFSSHARTAKKITPDDVALLLRKLPDKLAQFQAQEFYTANNNNNNNKRVDNVPNLDTQRARQAPLVGIDKGVSRLGNEQNDFKPRGHRSAAEAMAAVLALSSSSGDDDDSLENVQGKGGRKDHTNSAARRKRPFSLMGKNGQSAPKSPNLGNDNLKSALGESLSPPTSPDSDVMAGTSLQSSNNVAVTRSGTDMTRAQNGTGPKTFSTQLVHSNKRNDTTTAQYSSTINLFSKSNHLPSPIGDEKTKGSTFGTVRRLPGDELTLSSEDDLDFGGISSRSVTTKLPTSTLSVEDNSNMNVPTLQPKSQVAEILANLDYDSGPGSQGSKSDIQVKHVESEPQDSQNGEDDDIVVRSRGKRRSAFTDSDGEDF